MKTTLFKIKLNKEIAPNVFKMVLEGDTSEITSSGQFVNIKIDEYYLRRPISICDYDKKTITLLYKILGKGTLALSKYKVNKSISLLLPLGNGYNIDKKFEKPLLIGGGIGIPPLYNLCKKLIKKGKKVSVILGFNTKSEVFYEKEFNKLGVKLLITTVDGTYGNKGYVTDIMDFVKYDYFFTCGPELMLKAVFKKSKTSGQFSLEERMGCGFGACMGCSCKTITGYKRICIDGPVLEKEELL